MPSFNQIILIGNLTRDPELRYLPDQTPVVSFGVAVNEKFKTKSGESRENVLFIDCSAFGKKGETINQWFKKGKPILVRGRLKLERWQDKQSGAERSKHTIQVDDFAFVGGKDDDGSGDRQPTHGGASPQHANDDPPFSKEKQFDEADIPFAFEWHRSPL